MTEAINPDDPRLDPETDLTLDGPVVGRPAGGNHTWLAVGAFALLAVLLFWMLNARRIGRAEAQVPAGAPLTSPSAGAAYEPPPLQLAPPPVEPTPVVAAFTPPPPAPPPAPNLSPLPTPAAGASALSALDQRRRAPAVVVDLQAAAPVPAAAATAKPADAAAALTAAAAKTGGGALASPLLAGSGANAQIAALVGEGSGGAAVATQMANLNAVVPQGAMIPGVLETAVSSDLPGYTRAVVSRDVRSFDGRAVLIPRGSRLIGQYRSAVALGQSRVFVIWTRAIRPDGVSVDLGSPGADALGRGGLEGEVNTHFFTRFGGSILLSVLNAGIAAIGRTPSTQITIGSPGAAAGAAAAATAGGDGVAPTITIKQGEAINIFVARDLDFSNVQAVK